MSSKADVPMPAGTYFVGDPCYACQDSQDDWEDLLESCGYFGEHPGGGPVGLFRGEHQVIGFHTAWGDGGGRLRFGPIHINTND